MMAAGSSSVRLTMSRSSPSPALPGSADTHRACESRVLRTAVRGGHESAGAAMWSGLTVAAGKRGGGVDGGGSGGG